MFQLWYSILYMKLTLVLVSIIHLIMYLIYQINLNLINIK